MIETYIVQFYLKRSHYRFFFTAIKGAENIKININMDAIPSSLCLMPSISIRGEIAIGSKKKTYYDNK